MRNGVQLITYADRFGSGDLHTIRDLLTGPLDGAVTGVHLLPFFTPFDGADAGFDPVDHATVDPRLGDWDAVARIATTHDVTADLIVNHISDQSPQFLDFRSAGDDSAHSEMFLEFDSVFPDGASETDLAAIYRPRPGRPCTMVDMADGSQREMWTTFTSHQIDLDMSAPFARDYLLGVLDAFAAAGVSQVRLDAIGYAIKTPGTSCFMTKDTFRFIAELGEEVKARGMTSLLEVHSHYSDQLELAPTVDRVYDFALPPLLLHALRTRSSDAVLRWLEMSPRNDITVLDTHDGIGVIDVGRSEARHGLLSGPEIEALVEGIHSSTNGESRLATGEAATNLDLYQVNSTYYSALGQDDDCYLLARLIQFLSPGIPQVYYAGLLASPNDTELLERTGNGRDINRPYYSMADIEQAMQRPVVKRLLAMMRWRNLHPAFSGDFSVGGGGETLTMAWHSPAATLEADLNVANASFEVRSTVAATTATITDWDGF